MSKSRIVPIVIEELTRRGWESIGEWLKTYGKPIGATWQSIGNVLSNRPRRVVATNISGLRAQATCAFAVRRMTAFSRPSKHQCSKSSRNVSLDHERT